jgi:glycosyltransferase involved in cell wall biosynthesis
VTVLRVYICSRIYDPEPSAASFMLAAIARAFRDDGHEVTILTVRPPRTLPEPSAERGINVKRARVLRDASGYVRGYIQYLSFDVPLLFRALFARRPSLFFVEPPPTTGVMIRVASWIRRTPYFYDAADIWSDAAQLATRSRLVHRLLRFSELFALGGARRTFAISQGVVSRMRELGVSTPSTIIGFGVDDSAFSYSPDIPIGKYFVYAGTYSEWHGADIFVDAFQQFSKRNPGYRLIFVGNGSSREMLERRRDELGVGGIEFRDPVGAATLSDLLAGSIASLSSLKPGQGYDYAFTTKVYSSLAAGCPVVFTGAGPTAEFIDAHAERRVGLAVQYDVDAVCEALELAAHAPMDSAERRRLSDWAREAFSLSAIANRVVARITSDVQDGSQ